MALTNASGSRGRANVYELARRTLLVSDFAGRYVVDTEGGSIVADATSRVGGQFLGSFDEDESGTWVFMSAEWRSEVPLEPQARNAA